MSEASKYPIPVSEANKYSKIPKPIQTTLTNSPEEAAAFIQRGELAAFPTETVYGLGASVYDVAAIRAIYSAKERPADNPLIVHIHSTEQIDELTTAITPSASKLIDAFFPGPLTVIVERAVNVPSIVSAGLDSLAIRMPAHEIAQSFLEACEVPVAAPSANRSGRPSPTSWQDVYADLKGRIGCILKGELSEVGIESTVVDCTGVSPRILRPGGISFEEIQEVCPAAQPGTSAKSDRVKSPGMKYRHYAPAALVRPVDHPENVESISSIGYIGLDPHPYPEHLGLHHLCADTREYAHELFRFFRRCDRAGLETIYCQRIPRQGLGTALMDRIEKATRTE